jgi:hypothetical protein
MSLLERMQRDGVMLVYSAQHGTAYATLRSSLNDDWMIEHRLMLQDGKVVVAGISVLPIGVLPSGGLTTRLARRAATVGRHLDYAAVITRGLVAQLEKAGVDTAKLRDAHGLLTSPRGQQAAPKASRPGRKPLGDDVLVRAAEVYIRFRQKRDPAPVVAAAKATKMSQARMRDLIYRARQRGLLTKTLQGRGGGELTPAGKAMLKDTPRKGRRTGR